MYDTDLPCTNPNGGCRSDAACAAFGAALQQSPHDPALWNGLGVAEADGVVRQHCLVHALDLAKQLAAVSVSTNDASSIAGDSGAALGQLQSSDSTYWTNLAMLYITAVPVPSVLADGGQTEEWHRRLNQHACLADQILGISQCLNAASAVLWVSRAMVSYRLVCARRVSPSHGGSGAAAADARGVSTQERKRIAEAFECAVEVPPPPRTPAAALVGLGFWTLQAFVNNDVDTEDLESLLVTCAALLERARILEPTDVRAATLQGLAVELLGEYKLAKCHYSDAQALLNRLTPSDITSTGMENKCAKDLGLVIEAALERCKRQSAARLSLSGQSCTSMAATNIEQAVAMAKMGNLAEATQFAATILLLFSDSELGERLHSAASAAVDNPAWWCSGYMGVSVTSGVTSLLNLCRAHHHEMQKKNDMVASNIATGKLLAEIEATILCETNANDAEPTAKILALCVQANLAPQNSSEGAETVASYLRKALNVATTHLRELDEGDDAGDVQNLLPLLHVRLCLCHIGEYETLPISDAKPKKKALERACRSAELAVASASSPDSSIDVCLLFSAVSTKLATSPGASKKDIARLATVENLLSRLAASDAVSAFSPGTVSKLETLVCNAREQQAAK